MQTQISRTDGHMSQFENNGGQQYVRLLARYRCLEK